MNTFLTIVQFAAFGLMTVSFVQVLRTHFLSKVVREAVDETFELRRAAIDSGNRHHNITYPDIDATYANLKWYKPWQRPSTLLVYDKED